VTCIAIYYYFSFKGRQKIPLSASFWIHRARGAVKL